MTPRIAIFGTVVAAALLSTLSYGLVSISGSGAWPESWPAELEPFRDQARTLGVAHGIDESQHEIRFKNADEFAKAWPHILALKSEGAPLILEKSPSSSSVSGSTVERGVRILCPSGSSVTETSNGITLTLNFAAPWPKSILSASGELPEYVMSDNGIWVPANGDTTGTFLYRVRTDIVLAVDGVVIDLNRIELPANTPIIDRRFKTLN